jgi:hypothetical protein
MPSSYIDECATCGEIQPRLNHKCPPAWHCYNEDEGPGAAWTMYAHTETGAADAFCRKMDDGESLPTALRVVIVRPVVPLARPLTLDGRFEMRGQIAFEYLPF